MTVVAAVEEHGTEPDYQSGCRCGDCRKAHARYNALQRRSPRSYVPAGKVRTHIGELQECGLSLREIGRLAGVDRETVRGLTIGAYPRCTIETKRRLLGVLPPRQGKHLSVTTDEGFEPEPVYDDPLASLTLLLTHVDDLAWKADGDCRRLSIPVQRRMEWFFPERGESTKPALAICSTCPVWEPCLAFALETSAEGVWGRSAGNHRRKIVHHAVTVDELADAGMRDDPDLGIVEAIGRVLAAREQVA